MMVQYGEQRKMRLLVKGLVRFDLCQKANRASFPARAALHFRLYRWVILRM
jgi:hypothetical protein